MCNTLCVTCHRVYITKQMRKLHWQLLFSDQTCHYDTISECIMCYKKYLANLFRNITDIEDIATRESIRWPREFASK